MAENIVRIIIFTLQIYFLNQRKDVWTLVEQTVILFNDTFTIVTKWTFLCFYQSYTKLNMGYVSEKVGRLVG